MLDDVRDVKDRTIVLRGVAVAEEEEITANTTVCFWFDEASGVARTTSLVLYVRTASSWVAV